MTTSSFARRGAFRTAFACAPLFAALALVGCKADEPSHGASPHPSAAPAPAPAPDHVDIIEAPPDADVPVYLKQQLERARADGRDLLVYVGASWCEPCQRFHHAAVVGELDKTFPTLRLVAFDNDRDGEKLAAAGYRSHYIPLFAVPGPDGQGSGHQIEGSIKGDGAVAQITPRLRQLLDEARAAR